MSKPSRRDSIKEEIRSLKSLVSDLKEKIDRLEDLIDSSDEESSVNTTDTNQLQSNGIQIGTVVTFINKEDRLGFCPLPWCKYAIVLNLRNPVASVVKSPFSEKVSIILNTKLRVTSIQEASDFHKEVQERSR